MGNRLYVGNVPFAATNETLTDYFSQAGAVTDCQIMIDKFTGRSRGFAFVTMGTDAEAQNAISMFHEKAYEGRPLTVNEARPREERPASSGPREPRGFGGGGGGRGDRGDRGPRRERYFGGRRDFDRGA
jgi:cold-inducible RNA-binding protein